MSHLVFCIYCLSIYPGSFKEFINLFEAAVPHGRSFWKFCPTKLGAVNSAPVLDANESGWSMAWDEDEDTTIYHVVVNHEEQYSIWPEYKEVPKGWKTVGRTGPKQECLDYIKDVWTDMRPLSLRKAMAENAKLSDIGAASC